MEKRKIRPEKVLESFFWEKTKQDAFDYLKDADKLRSLVAVAMEKTKKLLANDPKLSPMLDSLKIFFSLVKSYFNGEYRNIPIETIGLVVAAILYFVSPLDFVPDFLLGLGLLDDAIIISLVLKALGNEVEKFRTWQREIDIEIVREAVQG